MNHAVNVGKFGVWAIQIRDNPNGIFLVGPDQREWIAAAARFIREACEESIERRKMARRAGKLGGRPTTADPKPSTVRSRKSRAKKKARKK